MPDLAPMRLGCPACLGVALQPIDVAGTVQVSHCHRCAGTWLPRDTAARLRYVPASTVRATLSHRREGAFACHSCHGAMARNAVRCRACGWMNTLECPACGRMMRRALRDGVIMDVCGPCEAVWLDQHELSTVWTAASAAAVPHASHRGGFGPVDLPLDPFADALWHAPDFAGGLVRAGVDGAGAAANAAASAPELAVHAAEAAAEAAGSVFEVILGIIGGIFEGLG